MTTKPTTREATLEALIRKLEAEVAFLKGESRTPETLKQLLAMIVARVRVHWDTESRPIAYASLSQAFNRALAAHGGFGTCVAMLADTGHIRVIENLSAARFVFPADVADAFLPAERARWREYGVRADRLANLRARVSAAAPSIGDLANADAEALAAFSVTKQSEDKS